MRQADFLIPSLTVFFAIFLPLAIFLLLLMLQQNQRQRGHDQGQKEASGFHLLIIICYRYFLEIGENRKKYTLSFDEGVSNHRGEALGGNEWGVAACLQ